MAIQKLRTVYNKDHPIIYHFAWEIKNFSGDKTYGPESVDLIGNLKLIMEFRRVDDGCQPVYYKPFYRFEKLNVGLNVKVSFYSYHNREDFDVVGTFVKPNKDFKDAGRKIIWCEKIQSHLKDAHFSLIIEVQVGSDDVTKTSDEPPCSLPKENASILTDEKLKILRGLEAMKINGLLTDFTYNVNGKTFAVHKMMLAARSPVFLKMFSTEYKDSKEGELYDISSDAFEDFLKFIYSGEIKNLSSHAIELLMISDRYRVDDLKSTCENHLLNDIREDNAPEIFQVAHKFRCNFDLKHRAFEFIKEFLAKWNYHLPEEFLNAPKSVAKLMMMKTNFEKILQVEEAKAEIKEDNSLTEKTSDAKTDDKISQYEIETIIESNEKQNIFALN